MAEIIVDLNKIETDDELLVRLYPAKGEKGEQGLQGAKGDKGETGASGGSAVVVDAVADMIDTTQAYLYVGNESGYTKGDWYYYDGTEWVSGGQYGADGGINTNARNILKYILQRVAYTETGMQTYVDALYQALAQAGGGSSETTTYMIMNALTNVTNSNTATGADEGDSYTATLTADTDYTIDSVVITMGGTDITSTAYDSTTNTITIASVTGDVIITASATNDWDYSWNSSSGVAPDFMTYGSISFAQDNSYATIHLNSSQDLFTISDVGDMKMEFAVSFPDSSYNNNPQFIVRTSSTGGFKVFPSTTSGVVSTNISGSTASLSADTSVLTIYKMKIENGACSLEYGTSESSLTTLTGTGQTGSSYYPNTGVTGAIRADGYNLNFSYFRYKKL